MAKETRHYKIHDYMTGDDSDIVEAETIFVKSRVEVGWISTLSDGVICIACNGPVKLTKDTYASVKKYWIEPGAKEESGG